MVCLKHLSLSSLATLQNCLLAAGAIRYRGSMRLLGDVSSETAQYDWDKSWPDITCSWQRCPVLPDVSA
jgi:hypothetical protein